MAYRMDKKSEGGTVVLELQGRLDRKALSEIRTQCTTRALHGLPVRLILRVGTEIEPGCLEELGRLPGVEVVAQAPFLQRWLERSRGEHR